MKRITLLLLILCPILLTGYQTPAIYLIDATQSKLQWTGYYLFNFGEHFGSLNLSAGQIRLVGDRITGGNFELDMRTIKNLDMPPDDGGNDLTQHLKSKDFFDVDQYPAAKFEIKESKAIPDAASGRPNFDVIGDLTIKEIKKEISIPVFVQVENNRLTAKSKFKFDRTKWGIQYNSGKIFSDVGDGAISDAIAIEIDIVALLPK